MRYFQLTIWILLLLLGVGAHPRENTLIITGSDTLGGVMTEWTSAFRDRYPEIKIELQASGSAAAPTALAEGTTNIGMMSRPMTAGEIARFSARRGHLPTALAVARDVLVIVVSAANPLTQVSQTLVDRIWSSTFFCSGGGGLTQWDQLLDLPDEHPLSGAIIDPIGRTSMSGSNGFFKERALCDGDFNPGVTQMPGFAAVIDVVANAPNAIGYVGLGFVDARVKIPNWVTVDGQVIDVATSVEGRASGYPLVRTLMLYLATRPGDTPGELECRFLSFIQEPVAQQILRSRGFLPIDGVQSMRELQRVCH